MSSLSERIVDVLLYPFAVLIAIVAATRWWLWWLVQDQRPRTRPASDSWWFC